MASRSSALAKPLTAIGNAAPANDTESGSVTVAAGSIRMAAPPLMNSGAGVVGSPIAGGVLRLATETATCTGLAETSVPSYALTVNALTAPPLIPAAGVQTSNWPGESNVVPGTAVAPDFCNVP